MSAHIRHEFFEPEVILDPECSVAGRFLLLSKKKQQNEGYLNTCKYHEQ